MVVLVCVDLLFGKGDVNFVVMVFFIMCFGWAWVCVCFEEVYGWCMCCGDVGWIV